MTTIARPELEGLERYKFGWADSDKAGESARRGLNEEVVRDISAKKNEPEWMLDLRLKGLKLFRRKPMPTWGSDLSGIDFENIKYFVRSTEKQAASWDDLPADIKSTYDRLGIPEAEKQRLIVGVAAQYESEVVYHKIREDLEQTGVIFLDTDTALKEHPDLFKEYFATVTAEGTRHVRVLGVTAGLEEYAAHYNRHRPHRARNLRPPDCDDTTATTTDLTAARIRRRKVLSGLIHEYERAA